MYKVGFVSANISNAANRVGNNKIYKGSTASDDIAENDTSNSEPLLHPKHDQTPQVYIALSQEAKDNKVGKKKEKLAEPCGPTNTIYLKLLSRILCLLLAWGLLFTLTKEEMVPGGRLLTILSLVLVAQLAGNVVEMIGLPALLGMLLAGITLKNAGLFNPNESYRNIIITTREIALTTILLRAGLELDASSLRRVSFVVLELSFIPCIIEAVGCAVFATYILNFPWLWGLLLGFVMGAVSPAIVVPTLLGLQRKGLDEDRKISTIVVAAASFDDIVAISGFGIFLGLVLNEGDIKMKIFKGPLEVVIGLTCGVVWGILSAWIPHKTDKHVVAKRCFMIGGGGLFAVLGSDMIEFPGSGPLACITAAFVASLGWKWQGWSHSYHPVARVFEALWLVLQPALFGLIGAEIDLKLVLADWHMLVNGIMVILGGLFARCLACTAVLLTADMTLKEMIFVNIAWLPKATVQAALGSVARDLSRTPEQRSYGETILILAVLSILMTAPIGAIGISSLGSILLRKKTSRSISNDA